ncbi:hypothetical protein KS4_20740 [Poriferisphaera corsica]|uniref:Copper amine oxidase n=1 Tax=Poriferisphaera corsica TaxID=2528020 RepID=A0A517YUS7_9BACT|nr:hypothetical protein [Poriferisphaera corsica]QDU34013.1 hypothetical protein KS4_20740 [Poriferisphaera corsica]
MRLTYPSFILCACTLLFTAAVNAQVPSGADGELSKALASSKPGQQINAPQLNLTTTSTPIIELTRTPIDGPQFLLSDMPEYFHIGNGIAMQERVSAGTVRLYTYHVPTPASPKKKISAVIENLGNEPLIFKFTRYAFPTPGSYYQKVAKEGMTDFFKAAPPFKRARRLKPGERMVIDPQMDKYITKKDDLVHAWHEFTISQGARITVFQADPEDNPLTVIDTLPKLPRQFKDHPRSGAGRGLFKQADYLVTPAEKDHVYDTADGIKQLILADGKRDTWMTGYDHIADLPTTNKGNYGAIYNIKINWKSSDKRNLALIAYTPEGTGKWCQNRAMVLKVNHGSQRGGTIQIPSKNITWKQFPEVVLIQNFARKANKEIQTIELTYTPPGASCLPIPFVLVPYDPNP